MGSPQSYKIIPGASLKGQIDIPGDKSISHRAVMLASIAQGMSHIRGFLAGEDCLCTLKAFSAMGVTVKSISATELMITGVGMHGLQAPTTTLDLGNAGTAIRLLTGLLAGQSFSTTVTGDDSLRKRPMARILKPLATMGAKIQAEPEDKAPLKIFGGQSLQGINYLLPIASAQVKSCLLLAGLYAVGETTVIEPKPSRDHTERMLKAFGIAINQSNNAVTLKGGQQLNSCDVTIPADISSAAFFIVGALISPNSEIVLPNVGINPTRIGVITILQQMGANIVLNNVREINSEPVADIVVKTSKLHGITIDPELVPLAIDEFPAIFIAAACAEGETILHGAQELRVKESDRLRAMAQGLLQLGITVEEYPDGMKITGGLLHGGTIDSHGDHRIAMAFAMAGIVASAPVSILDCANVATSFPNFTTLAQAAGVKMDLY